MFIELMIVVVIIGILVVVVIFVYQDYMIWFQVFEGFSLVVGVKIVIIESYLNIGIVLVDCIVVGMFVMVIDIQG